MTKQTRPLKKFCCSSLLSSNLFWVLKLQNSVWDYFGFTWKMKFGTRDPWLVISSPREPCQSTPSPLCNHHFGPEDFWEFASSPRNFLAFNLCPHLHCSPSLKIQSKWWGKCPLFLHWMHYCATRLQATGILLWLMALEVTPSMSRTLPSDIYLEMRGKVGEGTFFSVLFKCAVISSCPPLCMINEWSHISL